MRLRNLVLAVLVATATLLGYAGPAYADDASDLRITIRTDDPAVRVLVLTNAGTQPCQVAATSLGTVTLTRVEQDGAPAAPIAILPSFDEDLGELLRQRLQTLEPGASVELALQTVPAGDNGHALQEVSWSPEATIGALYPFDPARPLVLEATYAVPVSPEGGPPLCAAGSTAAGVAAPQSSWLWWAVAAGAALILLVGGLGVVLLLRRRRQRATAAATVVLLFAVGLAALDWRPAPAAATIATGDSSLDGALGGCLDSFRGPGGDPSGILPTLEDPSVRVTIVRAIAGGNGEYRISPTQIFVTWDPDDTRPYADGTPRDPCDSLYHELYHAFEDTTPEGVNLHECILADGTHTGIAVKEVNATKAENERRANLGHPIRRTYGGHPLPEEECRPSQPDDPLCHPQRGCPEPEDGRPADSNGDPHIVTFDGLRFDFQAVGEFVALHDPSATGAEAMQVQVRQQPLPDSRVVSVNTAVATDVAGDRVQVDFVDGQLAVLVNGAAAELGSAELPNGGDVIYTPKQDGRADRVTVGWPDTSYMVVRPIGRWGLHVYVWVAARREGKLTGLFGNADRDRTNDVRIGDQEPVEAPTFDQLYPAYADSLRVTDDSTLFTYPDGASTEAYTDRSYPDRPETGPGEHLRGWAAEVCRRFGVTDPASLDACIVDLINTGSADFAVAARSTQDLVAAAAASASATSIRVADPGAISTVEFDGTAGQLLYVDVVSSTIPNSCGVLRVLGPTDDPIGTGCIINGTGLVDTVTLPVTGQYRLVVDPPGDETGTVNLRLVFPVDQVEPIGVDGADVTAVVADAGAASRFTFAGTAGQKVYVDVPSATLANQCGVLALLDPAGNALRTGCIINGAGSIDATVLASAGDYTIVVDPVEAQTGRAVIRLTEAVDQTGSLTIDGPAAVATIGQPGAVASFTFPGTAGQVVTVEASASTLPDQCGGLLLWGPGDQRIVAGCITGGAGEISDVRLPESGTYTVVLDPPENGTGTAALRVRT